MSVEDALCYQSSKWRAFAGQDVKCLMQFSHDLSMRFVSIPYSQRLCISGPQGTVE